MSKYVLSRAAAVAVLAAAVVGVASPAGAVTPQSARCDAGQQVLDNTSEGVHVKLYTLATGLTGLTPEFDVCVRVEQVPAGTGSGGMLAITPRSPDFSITNIQGPTQDTNVAACQTTPNAVPGTHPIASGGVAGQPYVVDAYATGSAIWVCVSVGTTFVDRWVVPVVVPTVFVDPHTDVAFYPDPS